MRPVKTGAEDTVVATGAEARHHVSVPNNLTCAHRPRTLEDEIPNGVDVCVVIFVSQHIMC